MTKASPTYCDECKSLCFVFTDMRRCSVCTMYLHENCFKKRVAAAAQAAAAAAPSIQLVIESPPTENAMQGSVHVHSLVRSHSATISKCDVCRTFIFKAGLGTSERYVECVDGCGFKAHLDCYVASQRNSSNAAPSAAVALSAEAEAKRKAEILSSIMLEEDYEAEMAKQKQMFKAQKKDALSSTLDLLSALNARNTKNGAGEYTWSPVKIYNIQRKQSEIYDALVSQLPESTYVPRSVLGFLQEVLAYATAVYGSAFESGYMEGAFSNFLLHTTKRDKHVHAGPEQNVIAVANVLGVPRSSILLSFYGTVVSEPSFVVVDDPAHKRVVLAFRGSLTEADFLTDAMGELVDFGFEPYPGAPKELADVVHGAKAHLGIMNSVKQVFDKDNKLYIIDKLRTILKARSPDTMLFVTGHSLGAALTCLFTAIAVVTDCLALRDDTTGQITRSTRDLLRGYAFAPPPTVTLPLAGTFDNVLISVVCAKDCVPRLQIPSADRLSMHFVAKKDAPAVTDTTVADKNKELLKAMAHAAEELERQESEDLEDERKEAEAAKQQGAAAAVTSEKTIQKFKRSEAELMKLLAQQEECHIVGRIIMTTSQTHTYNFAHYLPCEHPLLHSIFISQSMLDNHLMSHYSQALKTANATVVEK